MGVISKTLKGNTSDLCTYVDDNLSAAERQVCTREMFSALGGVHAVVISDPRDIQLSAVSLSSALHGRRTELLDTQLRAVSYPPHCTGITDKNFELVELKKMVKVSIEFIQVMMEKG